MFAHRRSSQKPVEALYAQFKQSFPEVGPGTSSATQGQGVPGTAQLGSTSINEAVVDTPNPSRYVNSHIQTQPSSSTSTIHELPNTVTMSARHTSPDSDALDDNPLTGDYFDRPYDHVDDSTKETGITPKPFSDQWRLTPSLMDPNSFAFSAFANQPPGYYTPTPGGFNTFYHSSAAGDLHTPGMGMNTPLSMPHSLHGMQAPDPTLHFGPFNPQLLHPHQAFHDAFQPQSHHVQQSQTYAPTSFLQHQDSGYVLSLIHI